MALLYVLTIAQQVFLLLLKKNGILILLHLAQDVPIWSINYLKKRTALVRSGMANISGTKKRNLYIILSMGAVSLSILQVCLKSLLKTDRLS
ncbi:hypothetical protein H0W26_02015 [Candidatus Dependentiae bacterium]|nr:hypothetical protein [Candidatus Dependentiae bacterium]